PGEAAVHELGEHRAPAVELGVVEAAALEPRALGAHATEIGPVETAAPENAPRDGGEERLEALIQTQSPEVAGEQGATAQVETGEPGAPEVDLRQDSTTQGNDRVFGGSSFFGQNPLPSLAILSHGPEAGDPPQGEV